MDKPEAKLDAKTAGDVARLAEILANSSFADRLERWDLSIEPKPHHWAALNSAYPANAEGPNDMTPLDKLFEAAFSCRLSQLWAETLERRVRMAACGHEVSRRPLFPVGAAS